MSLFIHIPFKESRPMMVGRPYFRVFSHIIGRLSFIGIFIKKSQVGRPYFRVFPRMIGLLFLKGIPVYTYPFERESAYVLGKHSKIGSAYMSLFINIPLKESRPMMCENTLK
jgi:hypothetical protein